MRLACALIVSAVTLWDSRVPHAGTRCGFGAAVQGDDAAGEVPERHRTPPGPVHQTCEPALVRPVRDRLGQVRSEEHTSELQSRGQLGCRLLLQKKKWRTSRIRPRTWYPAAKRPIGNHGYRS